MARKKKKKARRARRGRSLKKRDNNEAGPYGTACPAAGTAPSCNDLDGACEKGITVQARLIVAVVRIYVPSLPAAIDAAIAFGALVYAEIDLCMRGFADPGTRRHR